MIEAEAWNSKGTMSAAVKVTLIKQRLLAVSKCPLNVKICWPQRRKSLQQSFKAMRALCALLF